MSLMNKDFIAVTVSMQKCQLLPKGQGPEGTSFPGQQDRTSQVRAHPAIPEVRQPQPWGSGMGWVGMWAQLSGALGQAGQWDTRDQLCCFTAGAESAGPGCAGQWSQ